ncbi:hypothetical protein BKA70DRAFT_399253 [Coprinopsis sp. MPI-PUGE-AT-0042]|nr:hypothetical protein BKA70DRAFT_399253 [Coprinopsis sp. MPI-PUGE-AT-0042]
MTPSSRSTSSKVAFPALTPIPPPSLRPARMILTRVRLPPLRPARPILMSNRTTVKTLSPSPRLTRCDSEEEEEGSEEEERMKRRRGRGAGSTQPREDPPAKHQPGTKSDQVWVLERWLTWKSSPFENKSPEQLVKEVQSVLAEADKVLNESKSPDTLGGNQLVNEVQPLLEQADKALNETTIPDDLSDEQLVKEVQSVLAEADKVLNESNSLDDRGEEQLVQEMRPLLEQAGRFSTRPTMPSVGAYPDHRFTNKDKRGVAKRAPTPQEQRLAQALKVMIEEVQGTIEWAKGKPRKQSQGEERLGSSSRRRHSRGTNSSKHSTHAIQEDMLVLYRTQ